MAFSTSVPKSLAEDADSQAIRLISEQAYLVPLNTYVTSYGISRTVAFRPHPDELPRFYLASWR